MVDGLWEWELEEIWVKLWLQVQFLSIVGFWLVFEYFMFEEMVIFKKIKWRVKKICKKEKEVVVWVDDLLFFGDQIQDGDFGFRLWGWGCC